MNGILLGLALALGAGLALGGGSSTGKGWLRRGNKLSCKDPRARDAVRTIARDFEKAYKIEGLATFLDALGWRESRFNPCAKGDGGASLGMFQQQASNLDGPLASFRASWPNRVRDPLFSVIVATYHIVKAVSRYESKNGQPPEWLAVRRWWKYPILVHDDDETNPNSPGIRERFAEALQATGHPEAFMFTRPMIGHYPGTPAVLERFGY